jgi:hypothetical protein
MLTDGELEMDGLPQKALDILLRGAGKEKEFIKIALPDGVGLVSRKAGVLD